MGLAKEIHIAPISASHANKIIKKIHYSGSIVQGSQLHFGVFMGGVCYGAMSFGPSLDKRKVVGLVRETKWNEFIELNRLAFNDRLPRNGESRALSVAFKLIKKNYPHIKWVLSFADGTVCGDGTIYRASGFILTKINQNTETWKLPNGRPVQACSLRQGGYASWLKPYITKIEFEKIRSGATSSVRIMKHIGAKKVKGFQLRYIYFLDKSYRERLTVPEIPFSAIKEAGAGMYRGVKT